MITTEVPPADRPADAPARTALDRAAALLLSRQHRDGRWIDGRSPPVAAAAQSVLTRDILGVLRPELTATAARVIRASQRPDGSWADHRGGAADQAVTVVCYVALRVAGDPADAYHLALAAGWLREAGGLRCADPVAMIWLWLAGLGSWSYLPVAPPEVLFLPGWVARWLPGEVTRATRTSVPLSVIGSQRPPPRPAPFSLNEIAPAPAAGRSLPPPGRQGLVAGVLTGWQLLAPALPPLRQLRVLAQRRSARWLLARQERDGSWGPGSAQTALALIALRQLGYEAGHRAIDRGLSWLDLQVPGVPGPGDSGPGEPGRSESGAGESGSGEPGRCEPDMAAAARDTALAVRALASAGLAAGHPALTRATAFLHHHRAGRRLDQPSCLPGPGRAARAAQELARLSAAGPAAGKQARQVGAWLLRAQSDDGAWLAGDGRGDAVVTADVVLALLAAGVRPARTPIRRAARWLCAAQLAGGVAPGGGWSGAPSQVAAPTTRGTSAVVLALIACGDAESLASAGRGIAWLAATQRGDGGWDDSPAADGALAGLIPAREELDAGPYLDRMCRAVEALSGYLRLTAEPQALDGIAAR